MYTHNPSAGAVETQATLGLAVQPLQHTLAYSRVSERLPQRISWETTRKDIWGWPLASTWSDCGKACLLCPNTYMRAHTLNTCGLREVDSYLRMIYQQNKPFHHTDRVARCRQHFGHQITVSTEKSDRSELNIKQDGWHAGIGVKVFLSFIGSGCN